MSCSINNKLQCLIFLSISISSSSMKQRWLDFIYYSNAMSFLLVFVKKKHVDRCIGSLEVWSKAREICRWMESIRCVHDVFFVFLVFIFLFLQAFLSCFETYVRFKNDQKKKFPIRCIQCILFVFRHFIYSSLQCHQKFSI